MATNGLLTHLFMSLVLLLGTVSMCLGGKKSDNNCPFLFRDDAGKAFKGSTFCQNGCCGSNSDRRCCPVEEKDDTVGNGTDLILGIYISFLTVLLIPQFCWFYSWCNKKEGRASKIRLFVSGKIDNFRQFMRKRKQSDRQTC